MNKLPLAAAAAIAMSAMPAMPAANTTLSLTPRLLFPPAPRYAPQL